MTRTLSKDHALAGLRVGYALGQRGLIEGLLRVKDSFNSYPVDSLAIAAAAAALQDEDYFRLRRDQVVKTRDFFRQGLLERGFAVLPLERELRLCAAKLLPGAGALCRPAPAQRPCAPLGRARDRGVPAHLHRHAGGDGKSARHP